MILKLYSPCISIGSLNRTAGWSKVGEQISEQDLPLWVSRLPPILLRITYKILDWSLLCRGRSIACSVYPGYSAEPAGHLSFLSRTYLSAIFHTAEWVPTFHSFNLVRSHQALFSAFTECLGKR